MEKKKNKHKKLKSILRVIALLFCGAVLGINVYLANANSLVGNKLPMPFGYGAAVVLSGSMEPSLSVGDLIIVAEDDKYDVGETVVFQDSSSLVVHEIIAIDGDTVTTKGSANNAADAPISASLIKGKVIFHIPYVGNVVDFLKTPVGIICVIVLAILLLEVPRRKEKKKDDEEKQKIIDEINRLKNSENCEAETKVETDAPSNEAAENQTEEDTSSNEEIEAQSEETSDTKDEN